VKAASRDDVGTEYLTKLHLVAIFPILDMSVNPHLNLRNSSPSTSLRLVCKHSMCGLVRELVAVHMLRSCCYEMSFLGVAKTTQEMLVSCDQFTVRLLVEHALSARSNLTIRLIASTVLDTSSRL
jgi:hypothetical protein